MSAAKLSDRPLEAQALLKMPLAEAEALFQSYPVDRQLEVILSTPHPKEREELYYLVPDCTELVQRSPTEHVLQVLYRVLGTGIASVLLPCLSSEQFEEIVDLSVWRDGALDEKVLDLWLFELSNCEADELSSLLTHIDVRILATLLRNRIQLKTEFAALFIEAGVADPLSSELEYTDERAREIMQSVWEADEEFFTHVLYQMFALNQNESTDVALAAALERAKDERDERVKIRDEAVGIETTEEEILQQVDLDRLGLESGSTEAKNGDINENVKTGTLKNV